MPTTCAVATTPVRFFDFLAHFYFSLVFLTPAFFTITVSGSSKACEVVNEIAKPEFKARMTVKLAVAGAFHTDFMAPAVAALEEVLEGVEIKKPKIPVISNVDAKPHSDPDTIKKLLGTQVTSPVLWENTMDLVLGKDFEEAYELGPGKVTSGILRRFSKKAKCTNVEV